MESVVQKTQATTLLYIDEVSSSSRFLELLAHVGLNLELTQCSSAEAIEICGVQPFDLVVINHQTDQLDGLRLGAELRKNSDYQFTPMLLLTSQGSELLAANAFKAGFEDYLSESSLTAQVINQCITQSLLKAQLKEEIDLSRHEMLQYNHELERRHYLFAKYWDEISQTLLTPLTSIQEYVSLVIDEVPGKINAKQGKYLALARGSCSKITSAITRLSQISELDANMDLPATSNHCLISMVSAVIENISLDAQQQNVFIKTSYPANLPTVEVDEYRFAQALQSLMLRCICSAGQLGQVEVAAQKSTRRSNYVDVTIYAVEAGKTQPSLNPDTFRDLANGNAIVALHGGDLTANHLPDGTTEFRFQLPIGCDKTQVVPTSASA